MRALRVFAALLAFVLVASAGTYTVHRGDTLGVVAQRYGVSLGALVDANRISDPDVVREGQVLTIPDGGPSPAAVPSGPPPLHLVGRGETLGGVAARAGTSVARLMELNGIRDPNRVRAGTLLRLAPGSAAPTWVCPVQAPVVFASGFGDGRGGGRRHEGVDLAAPRGVPVVANVAGVVRHHPNGLGGLAYYLTGDDGDVYYGAHLDSYVGPEGRVRLGQAVGRVGNSGNAARGYHPPPLRAHARRRSRHRPAAPPIAGLPPEVALRASRGA